MKNVRVILPVILYCLLQQPLLAQSYKTAAGVRVDNGVNLSVQQYLFNNWTAEGILHTPFGSDNVGLTLLAERHRKILFRGANFYYGAGGHYYWQNDVKDAEDPDRTAANIAGLSFIGGLEMSLGRLNFAVDWKPELHLNSGADRAFNWTGASVSVRYIIDKRERKQVKDWKVWDRMGGNKNNNKRRR